MNLSMQQVAEKLGVHPRTVRNMVLRQEVKAFKVGRQWRIPETEIERLKRGEAVVRDSDD